MLIYIILYNSMPMNPETLDSKLVNANAVATFLKVSVTCVYALVKGVRGWGRIEPLPTVPTGKGKDRPRYAFDMNSVRAWKAKTKFEAKAAGRRKRVALKIA
jgi:hypothetical protein